MAKKYTDSPVTKNNIMNYHKKNSDFSFEMEILEVTKKFTLFCHHGGSYIDSVTGKTRQFDIRCVFTDLQNHRYLHLAVECKNLKKSFPAVISRIPRQFGEQIFYGLRNSPANVFQIFKGEEPNKWYQLGGLVGKEILQIRVLKNQNIEEASGVDIWEKWSQAISSLKSIVSDITRTVTTKHVSDYIFLPILVVPDMNLWVVDYDINGKMKGDPKRVNSCEFYLGSKPYLNRNDVDRDFSPTNLHIFTKKGYKEFLDKVKNEDYFWSDYFRFKG